MAKGLNQCTFIGNLGDEPTVKTIQNGSLVANFSLAINETHKTADGKISEYTEWVRIVAWGKLAEIVQKYLHKGSQVHVTGKLRTRSYLDKQNNTRYVTEINCEDIVMLGSGNANNKQPHTSNPINQQQYVGNNNVSMNAPAPMYPQQNIGAYDNGNQMAQPAPANYYSQNSYPQDDQLPF